MTCKAGRYDKDDLEGLKLWKRTCFRPQMVGTCPGPNILAAYIDHTLSDSELEEVESHLINCNECLETVILVRDALKNSEDAMPSSLAIHDILKDIPDQRGYVFKIKKVLSSLWCPAILPRYAMTALMILACMIGFYTGFQTGMEQKAFYTTVLAELEFSLDVPDYDLLEEAR